MTKLKHVGPVVVLSVVIALLAGAAALATPPTDSAVTTLLARGSFGELDTQHDGVQVKRENGNADVAVSEVTIAPGGSTGWHHHPGVGLASVASGAVTFYNEECEKTVYKAGDGFFESHEPMLVRNEGNGDAVFYVTFIVPSSTSTEGLRIDDPQPENCDLQTAADGSSSLASTGGPSLAAPFALAAALVVVAGGSGVVALTLVRRSA